MINQGDTAVGCSRPHISKSSCKNCEDEAVVTTGQRAAYMLLPRYLHNLLYAENHVQARLEL